MSNLKLGVEVISSHNLLAKDGQGSSNAFVELHFDHQRYRTTVKEKDLNPVWNESFYFNITNPDDVVNSTLEAHVYSNNVKNGNSKSSLGKVRISGTSFVVYPDAVPVYYPLEKSRMFTRAKGELGLKVFLTEDPSIRVSSPFSGMDNPSYVGSDLTQERRGQEDNNDPIPNGKTGLRRIFRHLPNVNPNIQQPGSVFGSASQGPISYGVGEMRTEPPRGSKLVRLFSGLSSQPFEHTLKETSPILGGGKVVGGRIIRANRPTSTYDLVEPMKFLFVRVVKARDLPSKDATGGLDPYVEVIVGNYRGRTHHFEKSENPEWNLVFAFSKERIQSSVLDVVVKDKDMIKDDFVGIVRFEIHDIPTRVPPDSPLAPEWYRLDSKNKKGELMLAVWVGTQADDAYSEAWHSDAASPIDGSIRTISSIRSKVYHSPRLWYMRVNVIEVQDLIISDNTRIPDVYVKVQINNQVHRTSPVQTRTSNAYWNEDLIFVASEPFEDHLVLSVEERIGPNKDNTIGQVIINLNTVEKRVDDRVVHSRWFNLHKHHTTTSDDHEKEKMKDKFASRLHVRVSLEGGYHVLDESTNYSSDLRPSAKQLWKPPIGMLELGVLNADGLLPFKQRDNKGTADTFCVAKYGDKWIRTRTILDSLNPKFNEQYSWEVFDPSTVLTIGVFDNSQIKESGADNNSNNKDMRIGKVRIRVSTLETGRVYTHSYPLLVLHPSGVKKMGELHLAIRFSCTSMSDMMYLYSKPMLPKMHYVRPFSLLQLEALRHQAVSIVAARLSRAEPPLNKEVIEYMTDANSHLWSMRRSKANFYRLMSVFNGLISAGKWFGEVCLWRNPVTTGLVHVLFLLLVFLPELILPTVFIYMFILGLWNYRFRPMYPPHMNTRLSYADSVLPDELAEEFDSFPTSTGPELVRMRYDRLRSIAGRIQTVVGDLASQGERVQALLSWRDTRATIIFMILCLVVAIVLYVTPFQVLLAVGGLYLMRHPRFRYRLPPAPVNFFRRLPARIDSML